MRRNLLSELERPPVLKVSGDPSRAEGVAAGGVGQGGIPGAPLDHVKHVAPRHRIAGELVALANAPKQWTLLILANARSSNPDVEVLVQRMMAGHFMALAAFFMQPEPRAPALLKIVLNPQGGGGTYASE